MPTPCRNVSEELAEEGDRVGAAVATAQTKLISQVQWYLVNVDRGHHRHMDIFVKLMKNENEPFCSTYVLTDSEEECDWESCSRGDISQAPAGEEPLSSAQRHVSLPQGTNAGVYV